MGLLSGCLRWRCLPWRSLPWLSSLGRTLLLSRVSITEVTWASPLYTFVSKNDTQKWITAEWTVAANYSRYHLILEHFYDKMPIFRFCLHLCLSSLYIILLNVFNFIFNIHIYSHNAFVFKPTLYCKHKVNRTRTQ